MLLYNAEQWIGATDAGAGAYEGERDGGFQFRLFHGLMPETETSSLYFWSVANRYRQNEPEATEQLYQEVAPTFVEDRVRVEAQQARISEFGEKDLVAIRSDATRMQMRQIVGRLVATDLQADVAAEQECLQQDGKPEISWFRPERAGMRGPSGSVTEKAPMKPACLEKMYETGPLHASDAAQ
jgi:hypothetical protein